MQPRATRIRRFLAPQEFLDSASGFLSNEEASNNRLLGIPQALAAGQGFGDAEPVLLSLERAGKIEGTAVWTAPHPLNISALTDSACTALADWLRHHGDLPSGIAGDEAAARALARALGCKTTVLMRNRLFVLTHVDSPGTISGSMRPATGTDLDLVDCWLRDFHDEAVPGDTAHESARLQIELGQLWLWLDTEGRPVSLAAIARELPTGACIGPVFTPTGLRGRGYASMLTAALSQHLLDRGCEYCCLYTDLDNGTSNRIYRAIGYEAIGDSIHLGLNPSGPTPPATGRVEPSAAG